MSTQPPTENGPAPEKKKQQRHIEENGKKMIHIGVEVNGLAQRVASASEDDYVEVDFDGARGLRRGQQSGRVEHVGDRSGAVIAAVAERSVAAAPGR